MAGNLSPDTPTMLRSPTLPRRRRSNSVSPTTPTFLSDVDAPPPTKPVVYSPVPTCDSVSFHVHHSSRPGGSNCEQKHGPSAAIDPATAATVVLADLRGCTHHQHVEGRHAAVGVGIADAAVGRAQCRAHQEAGCRESSSRWGGCKSWTLLRCPRPSASASAFEQHARHGGLGGFGESGPATRGGGAAWRGTPPPPLNARNARRKQSAFPRPRAPACTPRPFPHSGWCNIFPPSGTCAGMPAARHVRRPLFHGCHFDPNALDCFSHLVEKPATCPAPRAICPEHARNSARPTSMHATSRRRGSSSL